MIHLIFAVDVNNYIGLDNKLPWRNKEDLQYFKKTTLGKWVVMGRKTFESLGHIPLPNRINLVLTTNRNNDKFYKEQGAATLHYVSTVLSLAMMDPDRDIFIIGGADIYKAFYDYADKIHMTIIFEEHYANIKFPFEREKIYADFKLDDIIELNNYSSVFQLSRRKDNEIDN